MIQHQPTRTHLPSAPDDPRAALIRQVLASRTFAKSARLSQFLEFICRSSLEGRAHEINEQQIGIHVFGRSPAYNPNDDSIVRSQARLLRQRLEEYFEHECPACPIIVLIPKGGYVPVFERRPDPHSGDTPGPSITAAGLPSSPPPSPADGLLAPPDAALSHRAHGPLPSPAALLPDPTTTPRIPQPDGRRPSLPPALTPRRPARTLAWAAASVLLAAALLLLGLRALRAAHPPRPDPAPAPLTLWSSIFSPARPVVIVPSDDGLVLSEELRRAPVSLDEYLSGSYLRPDTPGTGAGLSLTPGWLSSHQYTSTADLNLAMRLNRLPQALSAHVETRYARLLRLDDLKNNNIVLIGGIGANPWIGLFSRELNFDVNYDWKSAQGYVINKHPRPGEQPRYLEDHGDHSSRSYGVLAYLPGIAGQGSALLFEGSGMAGTEAAADFPFSGEAFTRFLAQLRSAAHPTTPDLPAQSTAREPANPSTPTSRDLAGPPASDSAPLPYFEVLLETRSLNGNGPEAQVLAWRVLPR